MKKLLLCSVVVGIMVLGATAAFAGMSADGDLSDWGITLGTWGTYNAGVTAYIDPARSGDYVNPGYGGNLYDAYAMYFTHDNTNAYIAFVSGFPQAGRSHSTAPVPDGKFYPGDLAFRFGSGGWDYGVRLNQNVGLRSGVGYYKGIYSVSDWQVPYEGSTTYAGTYASSYPTVINATIAKLGAAVLAYTGNVSTSADPWFVVEAAIPLNTTGFDWSNEKGFDVHWTMTCGNDALNLHVNGFTPPVPEPISSSLFLLGAGALGLKLYRRKKA